MLIYIFHISPSSNNLCVQCNTLSVPKVEQFWRFYSHMIRPGDLTGHSDFHLFKEGIKPMWEVSGTHTLLSVTFVCYACNITVILF